MSKNKESCTMCEQIAKLKNEGVNEVDAIVIATKIRFPALYSKNYDRIIAEYTIRKEGSQYCVFSKDGTKKLGCHPTQAEAEDQLQAIEASKHSK